MPLPRSHIQSLSITLLMYVFFLIPAIHAQTTSIETLTVHEKQRTFHVHVPAGVDAATPVPLLFMFHKEGSTANQAIIDTDWNTTAAANGFIVIYPQAIDLGNDGDGNPRGITWDIGGINKMTQDTDFLLEMIDWANNSYNIRQTSIFTTGYSNGGLFAYLAASLSTQITVFGSHNGNVHHDGYFWPATGKPELSAYIMRSSANPTYTFHGVDFRNFINDNCDTALLKDDIDDTEVWQPQHNQEQWEFFTDNAVNNPPNAVAVAPANGTTIINFDASNSTDDDGYIASYSWDFGDGNSASGVTSSHIYSSSGSFNASLTVTDYAGLTGTVTFQVVPGSNNSPMLITTPAYADATELTILSETMVQVEARDPDLYPLQYQWSKLSGPGQAIFETPNAPESEVGFSEVGTYVLQVTVSDGNGSVETSDVVPITVSLPSSKEFTAHIYTDGHLRKFIVHVPPSYDGSTEYPLLFMFHPLGSTAQAVNSAHYGWSQMADANNFIVIYPESLHNHPFAGNGGLYRYWNIRRPGEHPTDVKYFFDDMYDWAMANYSIKSSHVFTTGFSYGAVASTYLGLIRPDKIAAFGDFAGGLYGSWPTTAVSYTHLTLPTILRV